MRLCNNLEISLKRRLSIFTHLFLMMKKHLSILSILLTSTMIGQVGINTTNPSPASVLDVASSSDGVNFGGWMAPRVSLTERNSIPVNSTDDGLMIFLSDGNTRCIQIWDGVALTWEDVYCMPINQSPVANSVQFSGNLVETEVLTASFIYSDAEGDPEGVHIYTWYRADDASGTNQIQIQSGTTNTYTLTNAEVGFYIALEVTPVATTGTSPGIPVLSTYSGPVNSPSAGGVFISEIGDPDNNANARFIEVTNGSSNPIDISNWNLILYSNTNTSATTTYTFPTSTLLAGGASYVVAQNGGTFSSVYGFAADGLDALMNSNGDDNFELRDDSGILIDIYGEIGVDQTGNCAEFEDGRALRASTVSEGNPTFDESEWIIWADSTIGGCTDHTNSPRSAPIDYTPGSHPN